MKYIVVYSVVLLLLFFYLYVEARQHERSLGKLSLRIHVNGTRGKSSVTRLIAAGLRAGGRQVLAKTTGTEAKIIFPDGSEQVIERCGPANIRENIKVIRTAVQNHANAVVIECMAVHPELQEFCEQRLIRAHIGVVTNIRADHEDVMGSSIDGIAAALSNTIPASGVLVTTPEAKVLLEKLHNNAPIVVASGQQLDRSLLQGFVYEVIPDNVAIALTVCELAGVDAQTAITGMRQAAPDAGNLQLTQFMLAGKKVKMINALAANDPESTLWLWEQYVEKSGQTVVLLNCRKDRNFRTVQLCELLSKLHVECFIVSGDTGLAKTVLMKQEINPESIYVLKSKTSFNDLLDIIAKQTADNVTVFAAGNIKGLSTEFIRKLNGG